MNPKLLGDVGELAVLSDLAKRGFRVAIPFGDNWDYDLLLVRDGRFERIQVKYTESDGKVIIPNLVVSSTTRGRCVSIKTYTEKIADWIAVYDRTTDKCYYIPVNELDGGTSFRLRLAPSANSQVKNVRWAKDYEVI